MSVRRSATICYILIYGLLAVSAPARADDRNAYGARGRTVLSTWLDAWRSTGAGREAFDDREWAAGLAVSAVQFVRDNIALGGTLRGSVARQGSASDESWLGSSTGADLDFIMHVPLSAHVSLRFWFWSGFNWQQYRRAVDGQSSATIAPVPSERVRRIVLSEGIAPELLLHLSPSVALGVGPRLRVNVPLNGDRVFIGATLGPDLNYSFGPGPDGRLEPARLFASRGRSVLTGEVTLANDFYASLGFLRFVTTGFGLGAYAAGGYYFRASEGYYPPRGDLAEVGGGLQLLYDVPLAGPLSALSLIQLGYMWKQDRGTAADAHRHVTAVELQTELPVYLALHLYQGLVLGLGPAFRAALGVGRADDRLLSYGVTSLLIASL